MLRRGSAVQCFLCYVCLPVFKQICGTAINFVLFHLVNTNFSCDYTTCQVICISFICNNITYCSCTDIWLEIGRSMILEKWPYSGFARAVTEIWHNSSCGGYVCRSGVSDTTLVVVVIICVLYRCI